MLSISRFQTSNTHVKLRVFAMSSSIGISIGRSIDESEGHLGTIRLETSSKPEVGDTRWQCHRIGVKGLTPPSAIQFKAYNVRRHINKKWGDKSALNLLETAPSFRLFICVGFSVWV